MLIIPINEDQNQIDRVLKRYKKKIEKTGVLRKLKQRKFFVKPSVKMRLAKQHAIYVQQKKEAGFFGGI